MKFYSCVVWGNLDSDKASEQHPIVNVCKKCYKAYKGQDRGIINDEQADISYGTCCYYCEVDLED